MTDLKDDMWILKLIVYDQPLLCRLLILTATIIVLKITRFIICYLISAHRHSSLFNITIWKRDFFALKLKSFVFLTDFKKGGASQLHCILCLLPQNFRLGEPILMIWKFQFHSTKDGFIVNFYQFHFVISFNGRC